jgi:hypothetical protein
MRSHFLWQLYLNVLLLINYRLFLLLQNARQIWDQYLEIPLLYYRTETETETEIL